MFSFLKKKEPRDPDDFTPPPGLSIREQEKFFTKLLSDPDSNYFKHYLRPPVRIMSDEKWEEMCEESRKRMKEERERNRRFNIRIWILLILFIAAIALKILY